MDFYSNLTIFSQTSPHFGGKLTSFVTVLAQNTHVRGCRPVLYYLKVNISSLGRFLKPVMGIMDKCLLQPRHFLSSQSPFWRKTTSCVAVLAQNTCVYGCRLVLCHLTFNISSLYRFTKPRMGTID